jgi:hypothetical protein
VVTGDFYIAVEHIWDNDPHIGVDIDPPHSLRTWFWNGVDWVQTGEYVTYDLMIHVELEHVQASVGGELLPNQIGSMIIARISIIVATIGTIIKKKKLI